MSLEVRVPTLPESVNDATVLTWHKQVGDTVKRDENLVDLETDKVVLEVPAPRDGTVLEILAADGDVVQATAVLARLGDAGAGSTPSTPAATAAPTAEPATAAAPPEAPAPAASAAQEPPVLTPSVRRLVREMDIDPAQISGTGKDGRILKADVMRYLDEHKGTEDSDLNAAEPPPPEGAGGGLPAAQPLRREERVPMSRLRARIAERLTEAQQTAAILTTFNEVNLQHVLDLRQRHKETFEKRHGVRLGMMSFFVKAVVEGLKAFPVVNASVDGKDIVYHSYFDIGIAVGSPRGLVVPILRDADRRSFAEIEGCIKEFAGKAKDGSLSYEDLSGGTFTISNGGVYGSMLSTPILNPPQSGILGMHKTIERPVAEDGQVVIRPMMYLALSYDHRIIDGREAVQFLVTVKECLEDPSRLLLAI